ncbi:HEAT repeat domain-containing protein [Kitasatospora fiedleri]|uniref:HEAT repeat domain-containing protein n=1 Tax=Kitasatospora fiedleri TaxID=2991545 RepID=UPI00249CF1C9|nr:HEAT repeat domain-containing protein [Kitasatospora fiedleri]
MTDDSRPPAQDPRETPDPVPDPVPGRAAREPDGPGPSAPAAGLEAARGARTLPDPPGLPELLGLAGHPDAEVRRAVAKALPFAASPPRTRPGCAPC